jgi:F-type H+-transporting ATPase subunit epsilon
MKLQVLGPARVVLEIEVQSVVAEGREGAFGLLPRHADYASPLVPGILTYREAPSGQERFLAVDQGTLVKVGDEVRVSVREAVQGTDLEALRELVQDRFLGLDAREQAARAALASLEARFVRRFLEELGHAPD